MGSLSAGAAKSAVLAWAWLTWAWNWLGQNQAPLTVLVTIGGVLVAWRYVVLTRRLAEAAKEQAEASRIAAQAAGDQARTTRLIFEAQRPSLGIHTDHNFVQGSSAQALDHQFTFALENHGTVPAIVIRWDLAIRRGDHVLRETHKDGPGVGVSVPPEASSGPVYALTEQIEHQFRGASGEPLDVEAKVTYKGLVEKSYTTRIRAVLSVTPGAVRYFTVDTQMDEG